MDENQPQKGIDYLYLEKIDFDALEALERDIIKCEEIRNASGEDVYRIKAIIGKEHGIGVENLQGSGLIAGDTSKAYKDIFTVTLVTCRSVGMYSEFFSRNKELALTWFDSDRGPFKSSTRRLY